MPKVGRTRMAGHRLTTAIALALMLASLATTAAGARVIERERYSGTFSGDEVSCGRHLHFEGTFSGVFMLKSRGDQAVSAFDNYEVHEVLTEADGDGFIIEQTGLYNEVRVRHVRGTIYRYTAINVGQVFTIATLDGKAVYRNRGLLEFTFLVNTKGDSNIHNDVFLEDSFRFVRDAGKHPELTSTDEEFCAVVEEAIRG
jgi:hypothetical protein